MRALDRLPSSPREAHAEDIRQRLRDLPSELQPPVGWTEFRLRARERAWSRRSAVNWEHAAAAAGVTVLIASLAMWASSDRQKPDVAPSVVTTAPSTASARRAESVPSTGSAPLAASTDVPAHLPDINTRFNAAMQAQARAAGFAAQAEVAAQLAALARAPASTRWLQHQPDEPALVRVGPRLAVANLEDRIAWFDDVLTDAGSADVSTARLRALEQERARLVSSLAQVRYAQTLAAQAP